MICSKCHKSVDYRQVLNGICDICSQDEYMKSWAIRLLENRIAQKIKLDNNTNHVLSIEVNTEMNNPVLYPKDIHSKLNKYIVGQEEAKKTLAIAAINHLKKRDNDLPAVKSNILLLGPTGCGKTLFAQSLGKILDVPVVIADATSITEAGYVGGDVEDMLEQLILASDNNLDKASHGIIFIDEIDKIRKRESSGKKDVSGEGVQQALLKLIEGTKITIDSKNSKFNGISIDTSNILFIMGGSFAGIETVIEKRLKVKKSIGFGNKIEKDDKDMDNLLGQVTVEDLEDFGMIPELLGRLPIVETLTTLSIEELLKVLTDVDNPIIDQFKSIFTVNNKSLVFKKDALVIIATEAHKNKLGARGLRTIVEKILREDMYGISNNNKETITITSKKVKESLKKT